MILVVQRCAVVSLRRGSHRRVTVRCEFGACERCRKEWDIEERLANETRAKNAGKIICQFCSIALKRSGRTNPNARYLDLRDDFFARVDSEAKAYLLGWIASDGSVRKNTISIFIHEQDRNTLERLRDLLCVSLPIKRTRNLVGFSINSSQIAADVCRLLDIKPGKKDAVISFPTLDSEELRWAFLRGVFDGDGSITSVAAAEKRTAGGKRGWPAPRCSIATTSTRMLDAIADFTKIPAYRGRQSIEWKGTNALDVLGKLYDRATFYLTRKRELYLDWCNWAPALISKTPAHPLFRWARVLPNAVAPSKSSASDSGFDVTLIDRGHRVGAVEFFRSGIRVQPAFGWYFDLVPRSSITKSGYMLANGIGVIDRAYTGEILVALIKTDPAAPELSLPARIVQIIPRPIISPELVEVDNFDDTARGSGGFGSTG
jgi:deoxyuridine 5'-triphosphate nucleotidohydrolase